MEEEKGSKIAALTYLADQSLLPVLCVSMPLWLSPEGGRDEDYGCAGGVRESAAGGDSGAGGWDAGRDPCQGGNGCGDYGHRGGGFLSTRREGGDRGAVLAHDLVR